MFGWVHYYRPRLILDKYGWKKNTKNVHHSSNEDGSSWKISAWNESVPFPCHQWHEKIFQMRMASRLLEAKSASNAAADALWYSNARRSIHIPPPGVLTIIQQGYTFLCSSFSCQTNSEFFLCYNGCVFETRKDTWRRMFLPDNQRTLIKTVSNAERNYAAANSLIWLSIRRVGVKMSAWLPPGSLYSMCRLLISAELLVSEKADNFFLGARMWLQQRGLQIALSC